MVFFTVKRSMGVKVYVGYDGKGIQPKHGATMQFSDEDQWKLVETFGDGYGYVGIVRLEKPKQGRYVAVVRAAGDDNSINLKEVQIYHIPRENFFQFSSIILKMHRLYKLTFLLAACSVGSSVPSLRSVKPVKLFSIAHMYKKFSPEQNKSVLLVKVPTKII